jgi:hypothetical protein
MPTETEIGCFLAGSILAFYGFVDGIFDFFDWHRDKKLLLTGTETTGKITDAATYPQIENVNSNQYRFYAEFKSADNSHHIAASHFASSSPEKFLNTEVAIIYDPKNPDHSRFKNDISLVREVVIKFSMFVIGLGLILFAAL